VLHEALLEPPRTADVALNLLAGAATKSAMTSLAETSRRAVVIALVGGLAVAASAGCSSSTNSNGTSGGDPTSGPSGSSAQCKTGTEAPYANPAGAPLTLPAGITVDGDVTGDMEGACANAETVENASDVVFACVGLRNSTAADVDVTFPAGLTFVAKTMSTQNGMTIHSHTLTVPANGVKHFFYRLASLNRACDATAATDVYTIGNVTNDPKLVEVLTLAKNKKIDGDVGAEAVGQMIWDITDGNGVTDQHRMELAAAPDQ
jgi:hypothetical protein